MAILLFYLFAISAYCSVCSYSNNFDKETDWNIVSERGSSINNRQVKLSRGKFLSGSSGCNGTLCIRGSKQDFDDWGLEGWSGEEFFRYMKKVPALEDAHLFASESLPLTLIVGGRKLPHQAVVQVSPDISRVRWTAPNRAT